MGQFNSLKVCRSCGKPIPKHTEVVYQEYRKHKKNLCQHCALKKAYGYINE